ncbi:MAG: phytoene desaturase family protein, partial [Chitinophagaceae bacterium]
FERYFAQFGKSPADYYLLQRLDPSYCVCWEDANVDIPANYEKLKDLFESMEAGAAKQLDAFMEEAKYKYDVGIKKLVFKPGLSIGEFIDPGLLKALIRLDVFSSMKNHVSKYFAHRKLQQLMEFPVLFLGALAEHIPALYSLMNYADVKLGTWYPRGGMYAVVQGMYELAKSLGVKFIFTADVVAIEIEYSNNLATGVTALINENGISRKEIIPADAVIGAADYYFIEQKLLPERLRQYSADYWNNRVMAPGCLLFYVGLDKKLDGVRHHTLFFDVDFEAHGAALYTQPQWPDEPLFYLCTPSVSDQLTAPEGCENLFFLIPVAAGLTGDDDQLRKKYFEKIVTRFEKYSGQEIRNSVIVFKSYALKDFVNDYNAFKGNAYGLANTLRQTAILKPSMRSRKVKNLFFAGQLTAPGPGVPPSLISGEVAAELVQKYY